MGVNNISAWIVLLAAEADWLFHGTYNSEVDLVLTKAERESLTKMAEANGNVSGGWFNWEDHMLDILLFWWIGIGVFMVFICNAVLTFFGPLAPRMHWERSKAGTSGAAATSGPHGHENCLWLNSTLSWFYLHYSKFPDVVQDWIASLNDQVQKLGGPVQIKFEKVNSGSLPPKFGDVTFDCGPEDKLHIHCQLEARDLAFSVFASQQTHDGVKLTNLTTSILKLRGHVSLFSPYHTQGSKSLETPAGHMHITLHLLLFV